MPKRSQIVEIYAPVAGLKYDAPSTLIDLRAMPDGSGGKLYYGLNQKEFGTSLYSTATLGTPVTGLFDAKFSAQSVLQVLTDTGVYRHSSSADTFVVDGQAFSGTYTDVWQGIMYNDAFLYTNGEDPLQVKPDYASTGTDMASALSPTTYNAYALAGFREHLCLYHTIENGSEHAQRVRWTKKGTLTYSAGTTDFDSGTAGAIDLVEALGEIKIAIPLGITLAIYCESCIFIQTWVGGDETFRFIKTVNGIGTPSRRGAVSHGDVNYFISRNSFYAYYGGDDYRDIGYSVRDKAFREINQEALAASFVEFDEQDQEVLFHVPVGTATTPNKVWVYSIPNQAWTCHDRSFASYGTSTRFDATTIGDLIGTIGEQTLAFGDYYLSEGSVTALYGMPDGRVVKKDKTVHSIVVNGVTTGQAYSYVTPDIVGFTTKGGKVTDPVDQDETNFTAWIKRYTKFTYEATGDGLSSAYYSDDKGSTWTEFKASPVTLSPAGSTHELDMDRDSRQMRYMVTCTGTNSPIAISYAKINLIPQGTV